jgi:tetratricopeptide (TPR) repeat protein
MRVVVFAALFVASGAVASAPVGGSWKGKTVILKGDKEVKIGTADAKGVPQYHATLKGISYKVLDENGSWILVMQDAVEGWFSKNDAVLVENAKDYFTQRLRANPKDEQAYGYRAEAAMQLSDFKAALKDISEAIKLNPKRATWWSNRAMIRVLDMDVAKALEDANEAIKIDPKLVRGYVVRGHVYRAQKAPDRAIAEFTEALRIEPGYLDALLARATTKWEQKSYMAAKQDYEDLLKLQPYHEDGLNEMAWLLATCPDDSLRDGKRALELAKKLNKMTDQKSPVFLDTQAAAHAELGEFTEAVRVMTAALALGGLPKDMQEDLEKRLKMYKEKKKYRDQ